MRGQCIGNQGLASAWVDAVVQAHQQVAVTGPIHPGSYQIHHGIGQAPGQVAANGGDQHGARFIAAGPGHAQRADEGHRHEQAKDHLHNPIDGVEHPPPRLFSRFVHVLLPLN
ncbi:hypothetical protein D3C84_1067170 [compost metagenome]